MFKFRVAENFHFSCFDPGDLFIFAQGHKEKLAITYNFTGKSRLWFATYINLNLNIFYLYKIANCKLLFDRVNRSITVQCAVNTVGLDIIIRHKHSISRSIRIGSDLFVNMWLFRGLNIIERSNNYQFLYSCSHCTMSFTDLTPLQGHVQVQSCRELSFLLFWPRRPFYFCSGP